MYVVEHARYGHAVAWRFGQADIARNDGFKDLCAEEAAKVGGNLAREGGAVVVHREEDAFTIASEGLMEQRMRISVSRSSATPSRAKNSHWMGT